MQNVIKREISIKARKETIYEAIADPQKVKLWFPDNVNGNYTVGEQPIFEFGDCGKSQIYIVASKPYEYFAYRWVPGANNFLGDVLSVPNTLVEFRIREGADGLSIVTLTETGFAELPSEIIQEVFKGNCEGWDFMLNRLNQYFEAA